MAIETITLGGGCFWCLEAAFTDINGVESAVSGYAGGATEQPTYQQVCSGDTGHAEVIQVRFDDSLIDVRTLLELFFAIHDPTTLNRQGADVGTQYRSVIFYHNEQQKRAAESLMADLEVERVWSDPIVTELQPAPAFYPAEDYHQNYYNQNSARPYCQSVISPKLAKLRAQYSRLLKG